MKASLQTPFSSYIVRKLRPEEKVKSFDCGDADLNDFILNESGFYQQALWLLMCSKRQMMKTTNT